MRQPSTGIKSMITSTTVLAYYDPDKSLEIQCDSSQSGLGSVLMQQGRPVAYASRALTPTKHGMHKLKKKCLPSFIQWKHFISIPMDIIPKCTVTTSP